MVQDLLMAWPCKGDINTGSSHDIEGLLYQSHFLQPFSKAFSHAID
jgi:hypothetical protein